MAHRGLSANEIAGALISMMARSTTLQFKVGYIDARPSLSARRNLLATRGRTIQMGQTEKKRVQLGLVGFALNSRRVARNRTAPLWADCVEKVHRTVDINSVLKWNSLFRETGRPEGMIIFKWPFQGMIFYSDSARVHRGRLTLSANNRQSALHQMGSPTRSRQ
jgi:hypothetical protein